MKITEKIDLRINISDCETLKCLFCIGFYNPDNEEWKIFEISEYKNELYEFISFYNPEKIDRVVWYNGIAFDCPIVQFIIDNYKEWSQMTNIQIINKIYEYAQKTIEEKSYRGFGEYRENQFTIPCFDVFTILGHDNANRFTSLKKCEFNLNLHSVEEMPIHHNVEKLSRDEIEQVISYMKTDIKATFKVFKLVLGDTNHPLYKGNNQLDLRFSINEEFGIDCLNYSDIKIGDELMKKSYSQEKGIELKDLPKKGTFRKGVNLKNCIPSYIKFETPQLKKLLKEIKSTFLPMSAKWEKEVKIGTTTHSQLLGGIHAQNNGEIWESNEDYLIHDDDAALIMVQLKLC